MFIFFHNILSFFNHRSHINLCMKDGCFFWIDNFCFIFNHSYRSHHLRSHCHRRCDNQYHHSDNHYRRDHAAIITTNIDHNFFSLTGNWFKRKTKPENYCSNAMKSNNVKINCHILNLLVKYKPLIY